MVAQRRCCQPTNLKQERSMNRLWTIMRKELFTSGVTPYAPMILALPALLLVLLGYISGESAIPPWQRIIPNQMPLFTNRASRQ